METILRQASADDQSISSYKQMKNQKKNTHGFVYNYMPSENMHRGILLAPPLTSYSYHQQPPPLLPLPSRSRYLTCPPIKRRPNRARDQSLTPKKSNSKKPIKRENEKTIYESCIVTSVNPLGPDPNDLPKDVSVSKVLSAAGINVAVEDFEEFSGSVFTVSPPPSSLPLPKFSLRPKLSLSSCNAEAAAAAGVDAGATDNLRRLLRLR